MSKGMTAEDIELTQNATLQQCIEMINNVSEMFKIYLDTE